MEITLENFIQNGGIILVDPDDVRSPAYIKFMKINKEFVKSHKNNFILLNPNRSKAVHEFGEKLEDADLLRYTSAPLLSELVEANENIGVITSNPRKCMFLNALSEDFFDDPKKFNLISTGAVDASEDQNHVYCLGGEILTLGDRISYNSYSSTFRTNIPDIFVKTYTQEMLDTDILEKIQWMCENPQNIDHVCWPIDLVMDREGQCIGYSMPKFEGSPLGKSVFHVAGMKEAFPSWDKFDLCALAKTLLSKISELETRDIQFGCFDPSTVRVCSPTEVYFADMDNWQVGGFESLVFNNTFSPPEKVRQNSYLSTYEDDLGIIAELVFMVMMPGKTPYSPDDDKPAIQAIAGRRFRFPFGDIKGESAMPGMWRFAWSHLGDLRTPLHLALSKRGEEKQKIFPIKYWIRVLNDFENSLNANPDYEARKIYPNTFAHKKNEVLVRCEWCGMEHPRFYFNDEYFDRKHICNSCIDKQSDMSFTCQICNKTYYYSNRSALFHQMKLATDKAWRAQKYCDECKSKTATCTKCGKEEPYFFVKNGLCRDCRGEGYKKVSERRTSR